MKKLSLALTLALLAALLTGFAPAALAAETLVVYNWYDYIDEAVIDLFEAETGIEVKYVNFTTNEEMYVKLTAGGGGYDIIFPSDYIIERMIKEDMLMELDMTKIPNAAGVSEWLKSPAYDPEARFSVPYMWGTVGILYNTEYVEDEITSWGALFDSKYQRDVFMLDSIRDSIGVSLKYLGYGINERGEEALNKVKDLLIKQKNDNIVQGYLVDEVKDKMVGGEAALAVMWSGDAMYAIAENESLVYVVPEEGSNVWVDAMCVPKDCKNFDAAMKFIDFMCRPEIAYMNMQYIYYSSPIDAVNAMLTDEELSYEALNPSSETIANCEFFNDISEYMDVYDKIWMDIRA